MMEIKLRRNGNNVFLMELSGVLDLYSSDQLKDLTMKLIGSRIERLIINLKKVNSINSAGIGALIFISSTLKKLNCPLVIIAPNGPVMHALEVTRLKNYFNFAPSLKEALPPAAA